MGRGADARSGPDGVAIGGQAPDAGGPRFGGTPCELEFSYSLGANASFTFTAHAVYLPRPRIEIAGPQGVQSTFDWMAAKATSPARMCTAVLISTVTTY